MANSRQRIAKRRFSGVPTTSSSSSTVDVRPVSLRVKKKSILKSKKGHSSSSSSSKSKVHPLRVPGSKPGDGCFICKSSSHVAKTCPQKVSKDKNKICLCCRRVGHTLKNCPRKENGQDKKFCYNCGQDGHRLAECKEPLQEGGTKFAECFLCKQTGHLSKNCPSNTHGIYPKGGSCKICGGVTHLAKDCSASKSSSTISGKPGQMKLHISKEPSEASGNHAKRIVFGSGDDLEDDFFGNEEDEGTTKPPKLAKTKQIQFDLPLQKPTIKKMKSSPKVVTFLR